MAGEHGKRFNVVLDDEHAARLSEMAARLYVQPGTVARSLLSTALDQVDPEAATISALLDSIPGGVGSDDGRRRRCQRWTRGPTRPALIYGEGRRCATRTVGPLAPIARPPTARGHSRASAPIVVPARDIPAGRPGSRRPLASIPGDHRIVALDAPDLPVR